MKAERIAEKTVEAMFFVWCHRHNRTLSGPIVYGCVSMEMPQSPLGGHGVETSVLVHTDTGSYDVMVDGDQGTIYRKDLLLVCRAVGEDVFMVTLGGKKWKVNLGDPKVEEM